MSTGHQHVMNAKIIDGKAVAQRIRSECAERVRLLKDRNGIAPGLAVVLVGDDPASRVYVNNKIRACESVGIRSFNFRFPYEAETAMILAKITELNVDPDVHGILVQLPLPSHIDSSKVIRAISVDKDVDGFHLYNVGGLVVGDTIFSPCTPYGVVKLLESENIPIAGQNVVVVGASNIVGKPMALMLMQREATVSVCHAKTRDLAQHTIMADVLIVAAGHPMLIVPQMVKRGAVVIDVGINRLPNGQLTGDVDFHGLLEKVSFITPVPGGVGPMTVTMLLVNTIASAEKTREPAFC
jgi:methylenetetrahydrofolate dehydrogenase (NADP+)/methenyltetrahydrofolate cyclohydrolase